MSLYSWEFIALANIALVFAYPFLKPRFILIVILHCLPHLLAETHWLLGESFDWKFAHHLIFQHWNISLLGIQMLSIATTQLKHPRLSYFGMAFVCLGFSGLSFLLTPSLVWLDPIWGVLPGPVLLDPIIHLEPYDLRSAIILPLFVLASLLALKQPRALLYSPLLYFTVLFFVGFLKVGPLILTPTLTSHFPIHQESKNILLYQERPDPFFATSLILDELQSQFEKLRARLPKTSEELNNTKIRVFLYSHPDSKRFWMGAHHVEVGNFFIKQIHLSNFDPAQNLLRHELSHLIHASLAAPLVSYIDPFLFEGFAVALSDPHLPDLEVQGAALYDAMGDPFLWPRFFRFSLYPKMFSYNFSGAIASVALREKRYPWDVNHDHLLQTLISTELTGEDIARAKEILSRRPVLGDQNYRTCARHEYHLQKNLKLSYWLDLNRYCSYEDRVLAAVQYLPNTFLRKQALKIHNSPEAIGDYHMFERDYEKADYHYSRCHSLSCLLKKELTKTETGRATLNRVLQAPHSLDLLYAQFPERENLIRKRISHTQNFEDRFYLWSELYATFDLNVEDTFSYHRHLYYWTKETNPEKLPEIEATIAPYWNKKNDSRASILLSAPQIE